MIRNFHISNTLLNKKATGPKTTFGAAKPIFRVGSNSGHNGRFV